MAKEDKKVSRKRFDEIMGVAKRKDNEDDEDFEVSDLRYAMEECGPAFIKLGQLLDSSDSLSVQFLEFTSLLSSYVLKSK